MYTGVISWKLAKGLYIVPVLFAYTPIFVWRLVAGIDGGFSALFGIYLLAGAMEGVLGISIGLGQSNRCGSGGLH